MQPGFGQSYECSYNVSPDETNVHGDGLTRQEPVDFGTAQNTLGLHSLHTLFSLIIVMILLAIFVSMCQSCMGQI